MDTAAIAQVLREARVLDAGGSLDVAPVSNHPARAAGHARTSYRVSTGGRPICHLTVGGDLHDLWERTRDFATACPTIACRPLFRHRNGGNEFVGVEYFEGDNLESLAAKGAITSAEAVACGERIVAALEETRQPSTAEAARREMDSTLDWIFASPLFGSLDRVVLNELILPFIRAGALEGPHATRWTNRDLIPRNVLRNDGEETRLIDCEFAARTHFFAEDWWRWHTHSGLGSDARDLPSLRKELPAAPWLEALFLLRQMALTCEISGAAQALADSHFVIDRLAALAAEARGERQPNVFFKPYASRNAEELAHLKTVYVALVQRQEETQRALLQAEAALDKVRNAGKAKSP